jgi:hypothetical protein
MSFTYRVQFASVTFICEQLHGYGLHLSLITEMFFYMSGVNAAITAVVSLVLWYRSDDDLTPNECLKASLVLVLYDLSVLEFFAGYECTYRKPLSGAVLGYMGLFAAYFGGIVLSVWRSQRTTLRSNPQDDLDLHRVSRM